MLTYSLVFHFIVSAVRTASEANLVVNVKDACDILLNVYVILNDPMSKKTHIKFWICH